MIDFNKLTRIIDIEYHDILADAGTDIFHDKIRAYMRDGSFVDIWFSKKIPGRFSYHWKGGISMVGYIAMIIFQILVGKKFPHFPNIFTMVPKKRCGRAQ